LKTAPIDFIKKQQKPEKLVGFQYKIQFFKFQKRKQKTVQFSQKPSGFSGILIGSQPGFYSKFKLWMKNGKLAGFFNLSLDFSGLSLNFFGYQFFKIWFF
jgi:hypothetical protein